MAQRRATRWTLTCLALGLVLACGRPVVTAEDLSGGDAARFDATVERLVDAGDLDTPVVGRLPGADGDLAAPPLVWAVVGGADVDQLAALLEAGASVDARDERGGTALIHAAVLREPAVVRTLFEAGADVDLRDDDHQGVFDAARANPGLKADPVYAELYAAQDGDSRHASEGDD